MLPILGIIFLSILTVLGDFFIKLGADSGKSVFQSKWFFAGALLYALSAFGWFYVMKYVKLSSLGVLYSITTALLLVAVGVFYFKESLNLYEVLGVVVALGSIFLLARFL